MQILTDENGKIVQFAEVGTIPGGIDVDMSFYAVDENGNFIIDTEKVQAIANEKRVSEILKRLNEIDQESIRAVRAITVGLSTDEDIEKLNALETEAVSLRTELRGLET